MKTLTMLITICLLALLPLNAATHSLEFHGGWLFPSDDTFQQIYGGALYLGLEGSLGLSERLFLSGSFHWLQKDGQLTYTDEETSLRILPLGLGLGYRLPAGDRLQLYGVLGIKYYLFRERNIIENVDDSGIGLGLQTGLQYLLGKGFFADFFIKYTTCSMEPGSYKFNIGGFHLGTGLGVHL